MTVEVYGIRHHGPGSARSLRATLERFEPDCVLVEGPSDAQGAIPFVTATAMVPPVALLVYPSDNPRCAVYYPFAVYSPEWQALDWALRHGVAARFADLSMGVSMACDDVGFGDDAEAPEAGWRPRDPLSVLARAAGYDDAERWWEHMVEERRGAHDGAETELFRAILEGVAAVRAEVGAPRGARERRLEMAREACMRAELRAAIKKGYARIAFVCGAWHAPVLQPDFGPEGRCKSVALAAKADKSLLATLPKPIKVESTWIPWTHERLTFESGYSAGVEAPGWYEHLWLASGPERASIPDRGEGEPRHLQMWGLNARPPEGLDDLRVTERWLVKVARLLRDEGFETSSAQVIDAVRLADALASMRGRPLPGLAEMNEASLAVFCLGSPVPLQLIERRLTVGDRLGTVPSEVPKTPLQRDFEATLKALRLKPSTEVERKMLDLREKATISKTGEVRTSARDLQTSRLLHRLGLLGVPWGKVTITEVSGTWSEGWLLRWRPEYEVALIVMGRYGGTIVDAATAVVREQADEAPDLRTLVGLLKTCRPADLPAASVYVAQRLQDEAATATDCGELMDGLVEMVPMLYGDVRQTDAGMLAAQAESLLVRVRAGLAAACASLDDGAAAVMFERIQQTHRAVVTMLDARTRADDRAAWCDALRRVLDVSGLHGLVAGRIARILLEMGLDTPDEAEARLAYALSPASDPAAAAAWVEGFLKDSGTILIYDDRLWRVIDDWLATLSEPSFIAVLPLLRRTFSTFSKPERRAMGEQAKRGVAATAGGVGGGLDERAVLQVLPILAKVLGVAS